MADEGNAYCPGREYLTRPIDQVALSDLVAAVDIFAELARVTIRVSMAQSTS
jgi:hypothetical protein